MKRDYREMCYKPFNEGEKRGLYFPVLVYTETRDEDERPIFRVVLAESPLKVEMNGVEYWGISGYDPETGESQWYNYNDCVSFEDWDVLRRLLRKRFAWMKLVDGMYEETILLAKAQLMGNQDLTMKSERI